MKKFLLMFAAVAAIAFVGCKTETKPEAEVVEEQTEEVAPTVESVAADLLNCADEAQAVTLLDGLKAKAEELLTGGDQAGYFNILNILKTVWENNKEAILAKIPTLAEKMTDYITPKPEVKDAFEAFIADPANNLMQKAADAVDAAGEKVDAAKEAVKDAAADAKDAANNAVDAAKDKAAEGLNKAAEELKK